MTTEPRFNAVPGSFRDPDSRVFVGPGGVFRGLSERGVADWEALRDSPFFPDAQAAGLVVQTEEVAGESAPPDLAPHEFARVLRHAPVPFVSYPYEWPFSMLQDAAKLHLDLLVGALGTGLTMKDGSAYNVQWHGTRPVFVDIGSFERARGGPWAGYRQFCRLFLYPLMLRSHLGIDFHPWLRGAVEGIDPSDARALLRGRRILKTGVFKHVVLHASAGARFTERARDTGKELATAGFGAELAAATVRKLAGTVRRLRWEPKSSPWTSYHDVSVYDEADREAKAAFVHRAVTAVAADGLVYDLGCNDGAYSRVAAREAAYVVAVDADHVVVDRLYRALAEEGTNRVLPLVMNLADPSPGIGWRGEERAPFATRATPDLVLALALVHHLSIASHVPLAQVVDWLRSFGAPVVVELPHPDDPFVERLLANKPEHAHDDYSPASFEEAFAARFTVKDSERLPCGTRTLYLGVP